MDERADSPSTGGRARAEARASAPRSGTPGVAQTGRRRRRKVSIVGIAGELLLTGGAIVMLFVAWQYGIGDRIASAQNIAQAQELAEQWQGAPNALEPTPSTSPEPGPSPDAAAPPVVSAPPADGEVFGIMYVPRFGPDFAVRMGGGVSRERTLDTIGIGHYPGTQMPGEVGNFAVAAHRTGFGGAPFYAIDQLRVGDPITLETADGWYTYRFRTLEYVRPTAIDVLDPVPQSTVTGGGGRYLTMTSCSPKHTIAERIIAYAIFDSFRARADGPPEGIPAAVES